MPTTSIIPIPDERIVNRIFVIRGKRVMLDRDLAELYSVTTGNLNKAVSRNMERFPDDFMFSLTKEELQNLIFHFGTSKWGGTRKVPRAFTEQGVAQLSSVLRSKKAIQVNIQIIRTFTKIRELLATNEQLKKKIEEMEQKYDKHLRTIFEVLNRLLKEEEEPKHQIGFGGGKR